MGNFGSSRIKEAPNLQEWNLKEKLQSYNVLSLSTDPFIQIQQYTLYVPDQKSFEQQRQMYFLRKDHPQLIATKFFKDESEGDFCGSVYKGKLYLERIPLRLSLLKDIPFPDVIHFLNQTLRGGEILAKQYKAFLMTEQHIGVNQQGIVKVWQNVNYERTFPSENYCDEEIMVRKIIQIIDSNTEYKQLPYNSDILEFFYQEKPNLTFHEALKKLDQYANKYNKGVIPDHLDCVHKAGGVHVLTNHQKAYQQQSKTGSPPVMVNQSIISHPPMGGSRNMTQIPREQVVVYPQNSIQIQQHHPISQISKPQSSNFARSQAIKPTSTQFPIVQTSQIKQQRTIIQRLSQPIQTDRVKTESLHQPYFFQPINSTIIKSNSPIPSNLNQFQGRVPLPRTVTTQSAYPISSSPQVMIVRAPQQNIIRQSSSSYRNSVNLPPQMQPIPHRIQINQSQFKPLSPQQVVTGVPIERVQIKKKIQAQPIRIEQQQRIRQMEGRKFEQVPANINQNNPPIKFVRMVSPQQVNASVSEISSINPVNQVKKSYYTSEKPFSQLRGESINNTTVNFYNNFNPDSQSQWQQRPNTGNKNYQNVYPTIPQQLKQQRDYIHQSPAYTGSAGTFSFGNEKKDLKDGTSSQDFLAQLRTFKSYSPQKKQIQKQYEMLSQQQRMRQQERQKQAQQRQRSIQQQIELQGKQLNPKIVYSNQKQEFTRQFPSENKFSNQNVFFGQSPSKINQSIDTVRYENKIATPVPNRIVNQNVVLSGAKTPITINNQGKTVITLHSEQNSPAVKTPIQIKQQTVYSVQNPAGSLEQNLEMKYSMTQDSSYKVQWDPQILADLKSFK